MKKTPLIALTLLLLTQTTHAQNTTPVIVFLNNQTSPQKTTAITQSLPAADSYENLNAFSTNLTTQQINDLNKNPLVEKIFQEGTRQIAETKIALTISVDSIGAKGAWALGYTGRNITVAVIDTGIDYTHPDLGNCTSIGASCRVKGGYDYYNNDADPADDNSHGTHVAGIIGANGTIMGVAPQADFLAYKVCDASGVNCPDSKIIAAIDAAITAGADVISVSLAGYQRPSDGRYATEYALDRASDFGIISAVAAGNRGFGTGTIEGPADAETSLTVGATYQSGTSDPSDDNVHTGGWASGKGPADFGRAKPDIVAPGVGIVSTVPGGSAVKSGTSMATPHVSGAAAILLQKYGSLSPKQTRALLKQGARDLGEHVFAQGAGQLNITRAVSQNINASVDKWEALSLPGFNATTTFTVHNRANTTLEFYFTAENLTTYEENHLIGNSSMTLPAALNVSANSTAQVNVTVSIPENASAGVYGTTLVAATNDGQQIRIPVALSVAHVGDGVIHGKINRGSIVGGDSITIPVQPSAATSMTLTMNYTASNLHLYVFSAGGQLVGADNDTANPKTITVSNVTQEIYWIIVRAYPSWSGQQYYDLNISLTSNISVTPEKYQGQITATQSNLTFLLENDAAAKQDITPVVKLKQLYANTTVDITDASLPAAQDNDSYYCQQVWFNTSLGLDISQLSHAAVNLTWTGDHDLLLQYAYKSGATTVATRYYSDHKNHITGFLWEYLPQTDVSFMGRNYDDLGVLVCNRDTNQTYSGAYALNLTLYNMSLWNATTPPTPLNLSANESKNVTVSFNISRLEYGVNYEAVFEVPSYAQIPLYLTAGRPSTPALARPPNITNSSTVTLNWTESTSEASILYYNLTLSGDENFTAVNSTTVNDTNATITLADGLYFARVYALDANNVSSDLSNTVNFTVDTTPPDPPKLNLSGQIVNADTLGVNWSASADNLTGVANYTLQVSADSDFTNITYETNTTNASAATPVLPDNLYYARVRATDNAENTGGWSNTTNFTVKTITINEILPNPANTSAWIELYNIEDKNYSLAGWTLSSSSANTTLNSTISAGGYLLVYANETTLALNTANDTIRLANPANVVIDNISYENISQDNSLGRNIDGVGDFMTFTENQTTAGAQNQQTLEFTLTSGWSLISLPVMI